MNPFLFLFALLSLLLSSCENTTHNNKTVMKNDEFEWQETLSCPPGYAIDVFAGGLSSKRGFTSLFLGTYTGKRGWGAGSSGMTYGVKTLPNHLHLIWVSHFEHKFYEVDTPIDYQKMVDLFNEGYYLASDDRDNPDPYWQNYDSIVVGLAPGGVVVVWIAGLGRQIEIGRYQGKEITFTQEEIAALPPGARKNMHSLEYQNNIIYHWNMIPKDILEKIKDKPVPYGLWDTYRQKYHWQLRFLFLHNEKIKDIYFNLYNGEKEQLYGEAETDKYPIIPEFLRWTTRKERAIPKIISFGYIVDNEEYGCTIKFDEKEIFNTFKRILGDNPNAPITVQIYVNTDRTRATVELVNGEESLGVFNSKIKIGKYE